VDGKRCVDRFPDDVQHLVVMFSGADKGEPNLGFLEKAWYKSWHVYELHNTDGLKESHLFDAICDSKKAERCRASIDCCDFCTLRVPVPLYSMVVNDCISTRLSVVDCISVLSLVSCASTTIILDPKPEDRKKRGPRIELDMCWNVRIELPHKEQAARDLTVFVSRTPRLEIALGAGAEKKKFQLDLSFAKDADYKYEDLEHT
jgi:hypothetical protein